MHVLPRCDPERREKGPVKLRFKSAFVVRPKDLAVPFEHLAAQRLPLIKLAEREADHCQLMHRREIVGVEGRSGAPS